MANPCGITVKDFFSGLGKTMGGQHILDCSGRVNTLNIALMHLSLDAYLLDENVDFATYVGGKKSFTFDRPIVNIGNFFGKAKSGMKCPCLVIDEDLSCKGCGNGEGIIEMIRVSKNPGLYEGQYQIDYPNCRKISVYIPECIESGFVNVYLGYNFIQSESEELPENLLVLPALQMLFMYYSLPSLGTGGPGDEETRLQDYITYMDKLYKAQSKQMPYRVTVKSGKVLGVV